MFISCVPDIWPHAGRVDDVINVSGHRIGTAEVEGAIDSHPKVAEAAVVPVPHDIKGQGIYAFVSLMAVSNFFFLIHLFLSLRYAIFSWLICLSPGCKQCLTCPLNFFLMGRKGNINYVMPIMIYMVAGIILSLSCILSFCSPPSGLLLYHFSWPPWTDGIMLLQHSISWLLILL